MRLPVGTPVRRALAQAETPVKMPRGRPKTAWLGCMKEHIKSIGLTWEGAKSMVGDQIGWRDCLRVFEASKCVGIWNEKMIMGREGS